MFYQLCWYIIRSCIFVCFKLLYYLTYFNCLRLYFPELVPYIWHSCFVNHKSIVTISVECLHVLTACYHLLSLQNIGNTNCCFLKNWALKIFLVSFLLLVSSICFILLFIHVLFFSLHTVLASVLFISYIS